MKSDATKEDDGPHKHFCSKCGVLYECPNTETFLCQPYHCLNCKKKD